MSAIDNVWLTHMRQWDPRREIELRALCLFAAGSNEEGIYGSTSSADFLREEESMIVVDAVEGSIGYDMGVVHPEGRPQGTSISVGEDKQANSGSHSEHEHMHASRKTEKGRCCVC